MPIRSAPRHAVTRPGLPYRSIPLPTWPPPSRPSLSLDRPVHLEAREPEATVSGAEVPDPDETACLFDHIA